MTSVSKVSMVKTAASNKTQPKLQLDIHNKRLVSQTDMTSVSFNVSENCSFYQTEPRLQLGIHNKSKWIKCYLFSLSHFLCFGVILATLLFARFSQHSRGSCLPLQEKPGWVSKGPWKTLNVNHGSLIDGAANHFVTLILR